MPRFASMLVLIVFAFTAGTSAPQSGDVPVYGGFAAPQAVDVSNQYFVVFKALPGPDERSMVLGHGASILYSYSIIPAYAVRVPGAAVLDAIKADPRVDYVEQVQSYQALGTESNPEISDASGDQSAVGNATQDILKAWVEQPDGAHLRFNIKVRDLSGVNPSTGDGLAINGVWRYTFTLRQAGTAAADVYFVTLSRPESGPPEYSWGFVDATGVNSTQGDADHGEIIPAEGLIRITASNGLFSGAPNGNGNPGPGDALTVPFSAAVQLVGAAGTGLLATIDRAPNSGGGASFTLQNIVSPVSVAPPSLDFGLMNPGESAVLTVTLTNNSAGTITVSSVASTEPEFSVSPAGANIAPSSSANFSVTFAPVSPGSKNGQIHFAHTATGSPASVAVSGAAASPARPEEHPWGIDAVRAPQVWNQTRGQGIRIGILDTGIDSLHYELDARYKGGYNFVSNNPYPVDGHSHGTHVAGTIAAELNGVGVVGVAPEVDIYALKVLSDAGSGSSAGILAAIDWCVQNGMDIASMSLGGGIPIDGPTGPVGRVPVYSPTEELAYQNAYDAGLLIIVASGNDGEPVVMYPAAYQAPMSVGAVDPALVRAGFSNFGADLEIVGPGVDVKSTVPRGMGRDSRVNDGSNQYTANELEFAATTASTGVTATAVDCGKGLGPADFPAAVAGNIALIQRGDSSFASKVMKAQSAGAIAAIIYNNVPGNFNGTLGTSRDDANDRDWIPGVSLSMEDGLSLAAAAPATITLVNAVDDFNRFGGTSMATPHVSAVAALAWSVNPDLTNEQIREILKATATDLGVPGFDPEYGHGLVNAEAAVAMAAGSGGTQPNAGTISPAHPTLTWTSGPFTGATEDPTAADCSNTECDIFTLTVEGTNPNAHDVTIRLDWSLSSNDFDLRILDSTGGQVGASGHGTTNYEQASFAAIPGVYSVIVSVYAVVNESYIGTATLVDIPDPPTTFRDGRFENFDFGFTPDLQLPEQERSQVFVNQDIEPEIEVDRFGTIYIGAIRGVPGGVDFWRSDDGGSSFLYLGQPDGAQNPNPAGSEGGAGGGDVDLALGDPFYVVPPTPLSPGIQSTGRLYVTSLWLGSSSMAVSIDRGDNWTFTPFTTAQHDRQWNVARGEKTLYMSMRKLAQIQATQQHSVYVVQSDDGQTFTKGSFVEHPETGVQENVGGNIVLTGNGTLIGSYTSYDGRDLYVYRSPKEGGTPPADLPPGQTEVPVFLPEAFETGRVFHSPPGVNTNSKFPIMTVDAADNIHLAFGDRQKIYLMSCPAGLNPTVAANWTRPVVLNAPKVAGFEYTRTAIFPWIRGGAAGKVACLWYGTDAIGDPDTPGFETAQVPWRIIYAQVENAFAENPDVYLDIASSQGGGVIHTGQICNRGTGCPSGTRELAEYSSLTVDNEGFANIAYAGTVINGQNPAGTGAITFFTKSTKKALIPDPVITKIGACDGPGVNRKGGWHRVDDERATDGEYCRIVGAAPQAFLEFSYTGTAVSMQMARGPRGGNAQVWIDGVSKGVVDFYRPPTDPSKPDHSGKKDLTFGEFVSFETEPGEHVFRIDILNDKPEPKRDMIYVDGFVIEQGQPQGNAVFTENVTLIDGVADPASVAGQTVAADPGTTFLAGVVEVPDSAAVTFLMADPLGAVTGTAYAAPTMALSAVPGVAGSFTFQVVNPGTGPVPYRLYLVRSASGVSKAGHRVVHEVPSEYRLEQNYPNPFNPRTTIAYSVPEETHVRLTIFNVYGQEVATIADRKHQAGKYEVVFDAGNLASGVYFYKLVAATFTDVKRLVLLK